MLLKDSQCQGAMRAGSSLVPGHWGTHVGSGMLWQPGSLPPLPAQEQGSQGGNWGSPSPSEPIGVRQGQSQARRSGSTCSVGAAEMGTGLAKVLLRQRLLTPGA